MKYTIAYGIELFYPSMNGIITLSLHLLKELKKRGHTPVIFTPKTDKDMPDEDVVEGIPVCAVPSKPYPVYPNLRKTLIFHPFTEKMFYKYKIDLVHITAPFLLGSAMYRVARKYSLPRIHSYHTNLHDKQYQEHLSEKYPLPSSVIHTISNYLLWSDLMFGRSFKQSHVLTAPSSNETENIKKIFPSKYSIHIPNGVEISKFKKEPTKKGLTSFLPFPVNASNPYILFVGRLAIEKSVRVLLEGFAIAKRDPALSKVRLVIVGDGPQREEFKTLVNELGIANHVFFLGPIPHDTLIDSGLTKKAHFFCSASVTETMSMSVIEMISSGLPLLLANHSSMTNLAEDLAHYFEPADTQSLGKEMIYLIKNKKLYAEYKKKIMKNINKFDIKKIAKEYEKAYDITRSIALKEEEPNKQ